MRKLTILIYLVFFLAVTTMAKENPGFLRYSNDQWVDSLMNKLTLDQKIGQLFMIQAYSTHKNQKTEELIRQINQFQWGNIHARRSTSSGQNLQ